ncbi:unnamed protein product [Pleuronectes platessa]|uniref:Uncharacterized protein n=1 Tax=Pleuronectes platessa TaxID=8262 RepID=A0A9N7VLC7_PLEPL|nr:unnamed protein product [Pleuronectes platessa]
MRASLSPLSFLLLSLLYVSQLQLGHTMDISSGISSAQQKKPLKEKHSRAAARRDARRLHPTSASPTKPSPARERRERERGGGPMRSAKFSAFWREEFLRSERIQVGDRVD